MLIKWAKHKKQNFPKTTMYSVPNTSKLRRLEIRLLTRPLSTKMISPKNPPSPSKSSSRPKAALSTSKPQICGSYPASKKLLIKFTPQQHPASNSVNRNRNFKVMLVDTRSRRRIQMIASSLSFSRKWKKIAKKLDLQDMLTSST